MKITAEQRRTVISKARQMGSRCFAQYLGSNPHKHFTQEYPLTAEDAFLVGADPAEPGADFTVTKEQPHDKA